MLKHFERNPNVRSNLQFRCFHETKQSRNQVEIFFYNLAELLFEYIHDSWRILASFAKYFSQIAFAEHDRTVEVVPVTLSSALSSSSLSPTRAF